MTHAPAGPGHPLDLSLCGRRIFRGRYLFVKDPTCYVCQKRQNALGLPAAPSTRKGEHEPHIYKSTSATGGGSDA